MTINEIEDFFKASGKTGKTKKRADNLLFDNFLDSITCCYDTSFFYIKAICSASYTKNQYHQLSCSLSRSSAKIMYGYCSCKAGQGGFCNHIYALLKLMAQFVLDKLDNIPLQLPCTSRPCGWTVPNVRRMDVAKQTVMETTIKKPKLGKKVSSGIKCNLYEARSKDEQVYNTNAIFEMKDYLNEINPNIPLVHGLRNSVFTDAWCETKFGKVPIFCPLAYQCNKLGNNFNVYVNIDPVTASSPSTTATYPDFPHHHIPQYFKYDHYVSDPMQQTKLQELCVTHVQAVALEQATQTQSQNKLWFTERKCRITASKIHDVFYWKRGMNKHAEKFVEGDLSRSTTPDILQKKLDHGIMYESVALEKYKVCMQEEVTNVEVLPCGLVVNENNCWLGCSPDAKVVTGDIYGIAECKCPEQYKHSDLFDVAASNDSDKFMLHVKDGKLHLRETHRAYYQIQCQLALTGSEFCDLVVYTFKSLAIVRIIFNERFWRNVIDEIGPKYFKYILPKL